MNHFHINHFELVLGSSTGFIMCYLPLLIMEIIDVVQNVGTLNHFKNLHP